MEALLPSLISKESPAGYKGTAMGVYSTSQFLGVAIGGSLGGWIDGMFDGQGISRWRNAGRSVAGSRQYHERTAVCQQFAH